LTDNPEVVRACGKLAAAISGVWQSRRCDQRRAARRLRRSAATGNAAAVSAAYGKAAAAISDARRLVARSPMGLVDAEAKRS
jgi:uncharacterized protein YoxC